MSKKKQVPTIRSGAAEYLTFVAATGQSGVNASTPTRTTGCAKEDGGFELRLNTTKNNHLKKIFADRELLENAVIKIFE
jgi:hypothetical protein